MFLLTLSFYGQNLKSHQWKNRVLVIYSEDSNSEILKNQLDLFSDKKSEIKERKLIIYQVSKNQFKAL